MSKDLAISVQQVSKAYRIWESPGSRLVAPLASLAGKILPAGPRRLLEDNARSRYRDFWALREISLEVGRGESVGIIGRNGSGKSTLLQIIAGTLQPTLGQVGVQGRVAALLELGSGFNPEFTGRENVILNGTILGFTAQQMAEKFDGIASFADIGDFMDEPVKTYSSGMMMRLAFAVQTAVEPDILIIDEALSVGDFFFSQKCFKRINQLRERGTTLLFVSHDTASVRDLCSRALYLRAGRMAYLGESQAAIALYFRDGADADIGLPADGPTDPVATSKSELTRALDVAVWRRSPPGPVPGLSASLEAIVTRTPAGEPRTKFLMGGKAVFDLYFRTAAATDVHVVLELKNRHGQMVSSLGTRVLGMAPAAVKAGQVWCCTVEVDLVLEAGEYSFQACIGLPHPQPNVGIRHDETPWLGPLTIDWDYGSQPAPFLGMFQVPSTIALRELQE